MELSIAVLQTIEKTTRIPPFSCGKCPITTEVVIFKASLIHISIVFQNALLFTAILILTLEAIVWATFFTLSV